ncbi:phage/plasmid primase, P4 family [Candidatus Uabimicrobium sp. HlEnr_7]|uniref:phage/plasmid primase, P4 family n=1 Tax=Candidatus Uabimicrobium helgolandensis TaxID=3095367 RepID=UPI003558F2D1
MSIKKTKNHRKQQKAKDYQEFNLININDPNIIDDLKKSGLNSDICEGIIHKVPSGKKGTQELKDNIGRSKYKGQHLLQVQHFIYKINYLHAPGYARYKAHPPIDGMKYLSPLKQVYDGYHLFFHPSVEKNLCKDSKPLIITEGEKKCLKLQQELGQNYCAIGFPGITQWLDAPEWSQIKCKGRAVYICFDNPKSDQESNSNIEKQKLSLFLFLYSEGARVHNITFPEKYTGIDDYLAALKHPAKKILERIEKAQKDIFSSFKTITIEDAAKYLAKYKTSNIMVKQLWEDALKERFKCRLKDLESLLRDKAKAQLEQNSPEWISYTKDGHPKIVTGLLAKSMLQKSNPLLFHQEEFWLYNNGYWQSEDPRRLKREIQRVLGYELAKRKDIEDVYYQMQNECIANRSFDFNNARGFLNLENGILDLKSMKLFTHDKDYYFTLKLGVKYNQQADCPQWKNFLNDLLFSPETLQRLQEWFGYILTPSTKIQKALFLKGDGANGKSVILEVIGALLGEYCGHSEITKLEERFNRVNIRGKLVNISTDVDTTTTLNDTFKKLVAGEPITGEFKGKDSFEFRPFCRYIFAANDYIPSRDKGNSFFRRIDIITFSRIFSEAERDEDLAQKIIDSELSGILNWALEGLKRLRENNWKMTNSDEMKTSLVEFQEDSNPVLQFIQNCCTVEDKVYTPCASLYKAYNEWCKENNYKPKTSARFGRELKKLATSENWPVERKQKSKGWSYQGVRLNPGMQQI